MENRRLVDGFYPLVLLHPRSNGDRDALSAKTGASPSAVVKAVALYYRRDFSHLSATTARSGHCWHIGTLRLPRSFDPPGGWSNCGRLSVILCRDRSPNQPPASLGASSPRWHKYFTFGRMPVGVTDRVGCGAEIFTNLIKTFFRTAGGAIAPPLFYIVRGAIPPCLPRFNEVVILALPLKICTNDSHPLCSTIRMNSIF